MYRYRCYSPFFAVSVEKQPKPDTLFILFILTYLLGDFFVSDINYIFKMYSSMLYVAVHENVSW